MTFVRRHGPILAFIILALITGIALRSVVVQGNDAIYRGEIQQCSLVNRISNESNKRGQAGKESTQILREFLQSARAARIAAFHQTHEATDEIAAQSYSDLIQRLDRHVRFNTTPLIDCKKAIPKP